MAKNLGGRPTIMTKEVIQKLEDAFTVGATNLEAAIYAGISESLLYKYKSENPEFVERIDSLKGLTGLKAKMVIEKSIDKGDKDTAKWHLERRDHDYKPKSKIDQEVKIGAHKSLIEAILQKKNTRGCDDC